MNKQEKIAVGLLLLLLIAWGYFTRPQSPMMDSEESASEVIESSSRSVASSALIPEPGDGKNTNAVITAVEADHIPNLVEPRNTGDNGYRRS
ncbi:MAG: hypothetical protein JXN60_03720, partial [Lentisphaerae bacterium]|nr:hypothetical protein [Lentisphaerota bacterium]